MRLIVLRARKFKRVSCDRPRLRDRRGPNEPVWHEVDARNPRYTKRFAFYVGKRCRSASIKDIATELALDWPTVKDLEKQYMREQLRRAGTPRDPRSSASTRSRCENATPTASW